MYHSLHDLSFPIRCVLLAALYLNSFLQVSLYAHFVDCQDTISKKLKIFFKDFQGSFSNALWFCPYLSTILNAFVEIVNTFRQYFFVFFSVQNVFHAQFHRSQTNLPIYDGQFQGL